MLTAGEKKLGDDAFDVGDSAFTVGDSVHELGDKTLEAVHSARRTADADASVRQVQDEIGDSVRLPRD